MKTGIEDVVFCYNYLFVIFWVIAIGAIIHFIVT